MYSAAQLKSDLLTLVGWRQNYDPNGTQLTDLTTSESGLYFNDEHPLLNIENLLSIAPEFTKITGASETFTDWLRDKTEAGIIRAIDAWLAKKIFLNTGANLLERKQLLEVAGNARDEDTNNSRVAGLEIVPVRSRNISTTITAIGLQFDTSQTVTVYLMKESMTGSITQQSVSYTTAGQLQWQSVNWELEGSGAYYIVVDQSAITGNSINSVYEHANACGGIAHIPGGKFFKASAFDVDAGWIGSPSMWDLDDMNYTRYTNYGLNLRLDVQCDFTTMILEQKELFKTIIAKQVAIDLLREIAFNSTARINRHESNVDKTTLLYEIDGDSQGRPGGMRKQLEDAIDAIQFDSTNIDKYCLPCRRKGVKYKVV